MPNNQSTNDGPTSFLNRLSRLFSFYLFALFNWLLYLGLALRKGTFFKKPTEQDELQLAIARDQFWNLSKQPIPGFEHAFYKLRNGLSLHYITNRPMHTTNGDRRNGSGNLFIFLHGYPDSCMIWRHCLQEPVVPTSTATLICVDLPNYGGSDTFDPPDTSVLEALTEFIVAMREQHADAAGSDVDDFSTIIVAHDWGCVIAYRLAAEAPQLADRFILSNGPHVGLSTANLKRITGSAGKIFKQFRDDPRNNTACLTKSITTLKPLIRQMFLSGYIFVFHLPSLMVKYLGTGGNFSFLSAALRAQVGRNIDEWDRGAAFASTLGPGIIEVESSTRDGKTYGKVVHARAAGAGEVMWQQTAYYRHGLANSQWQKSLETIADLYNLETESDASNSPNRRRSSSSASSALFTEQYQGALKAPATIMWGEKDLALSRVICLDGISDYLAKGSEVILLPQTGHWAQCEREGRGAIAKVIGMCAAAGPNLPAYFTKDINEVYEGATSLVRK